MTGDDDGQAPWQDIEHWFHQASDWPPEQRWERLRESGVAEPVLVEVLSLLEASESSDGFRETSPHLVALDWSEQHTPQAPGKRITTYCDKYRLDLRSRLRLLVKVCREVEQAHRQGKLHLDIQPSTIRVDGESGPPRLVILSLGSTEVSKAREEKMQASGKALGRPPGHPEYNSPEVMAGGIDAMDTRSNVYSLGVLLWELVIGLRPYSGGQLLHLADLPTDAQPPPPSLRFQRIAQEPREVIAEVRQRDSKSLIRDLRPDLDWIASRATHLDPTQRYASVGELVTDLEGWLDGRGAPSRPAGFLGRVGEALRRRFGG